MSRGVGGSYARSVWEDHAHVFDLDPDKYETPSIKQLGIPVFSYYDPMQDTIGMGTPWREGTFKHEMRHKVSADSLYQPLTEASEEGNNDFLGFAAERTLLSKRFCSERDAELAEAVTENSEMFRSNRRNVSGWMSSTTGSNFEETLTHSFDEEGFHGRFPELKSVAYPLASLGVAVAAGKLAVDDFKRGEYIGGTLPALITAFGSLATFKYGNILDTGPKIRKLRKMRPEVRKFHSLGPRRGETIEEFTSALDQTGILD